MGTMTADFRGEVAVITGASGGMGRAIAEAFGRAGATVVLGDVDVAGGRETEAAVTAAGGRATFVETDTAEDAAVAALIAVAVAADGVFRTAVNAAAIENETLPLHECDDDLYDRMLAVNGRGVFSSMKHELRAMLDNAPDDRGQRGSIVNIASTNAVRPQGGQPAYTASKHAVLGLTRSAALDYAGHGIRINAICPGAIDTPMLRGAMARRGRDADEVASRLSLFGRFGTPSEIADAALWLASDASSFTTGHALAVDAGYLAR